MPGPMSGLYVREATFTSDGTASSAGTHVARVELRLDIDGRRPLNAASIAVYLSGRSPQHCMLELPRQANTTRWYGLLKYRRGDLVPPLDTQVILEWGHPGGSGPPIMHVEFPVQGWKIDLPKADKFFRQWHLTVHSYTPAPLSPGLLPIEHKIDYTLDPLYDPDIPPQYFTIPSVMQQAGMAVALPGGVQEIDPASVPAAAAFGWDDSQMHDLMEEYWELYRDEKQWAAWLFLTTKYVHPDDAGNAVAGMMFDSIGANKRQGAAVFTKRIEDNSHLQGQGLAKPWGLRYKFFTAVHELGHCLHLVHSWDKSAGKPWKRLISDPDARSFMNSPKRFVVEVSNDLNDYQFFKGPPEFEYEFTDDELLFLRHAPEEFVIFGGDALYKDHALTMAEGASLQDFRLSFDLPAGGFDYLEPAWADVVLETDLSPGVNVDRTVLKDPESLYVRITAPDGTMRWHRPWIRRCYQLQRPGWQLTSGRPLRQSMHLFAGADGWYLRQSGTYKIAAAVQLGELGVVVCPEQEFTVGPPGTHLRSGLVDQWFTDQMAIYFMLRGSQHERFANCRAVADELESTWPESRASVYIAYSRLRAAIRDTVGVSPDVRDSNSQLRLRIARHADLDTAVPGLAALFEDPQTRRVMGEMGLGSSLVESMMTLAAQSERTVIADSSSRLQDIYQNSVAEVVRDQLGWPDLHPGG